MNNRGIKKYLGIGALLLLTSISTHQHVSNQERQQRNLTIPTSLENKIKRIHLVSKVDNSLASTSPKYAIKGKEKILLYPIIEMDKGGKTEYIGRVNKAQMENVMVNVTSPEKSALNGTADGLEIEWYKVEPVLRTQIDPYQNASIKTKKWIGWTKIGYKKNLCSVTKGLEPIIAESKPSTGKGIDGLGTMRYSVSITLGEKKLSTPDHTSTNQRGIKENVIRIAYIKDKSFLGWLTSYFNVPGLFGSASSNGQSPPSQHQTEQYQGFDCADLMVGAYRHISQNTGYSSCNDLRQKTQFLGPFELNPSGNITKNSKKVNLTFGKDIKEGDMIFFDYNMDGYYDHVGAIYKDRKITSTFDVILDVLKRKRNQGNGVFDKGDLIIHYDFKTAAPYPLYYFGVYGGKSKIIFGRF